MSNTDFAWLIEAPGARYLGVREFPKYCFEFFWATDHEQATRFYSEAQADGVMMAVRRMEPALFAFAVNLGDARPIEHGWINRLKEQVVGITPTEKMGPSLDPQRAAP